MKFCQSERTLQQEHKYTPPCNYYQPANHDNKIKTGSLFGPTLPKEQPNFGQSTRFGMNSEKKAPGPGSYFNDRISDNVKTLVKTGVVIR